MKPKIKRAYEEAAKEDGCRVLVDRIWPRGLSKEKAHIDEWIKEVAPSGDLRKWFGHEPEKWAEFKRRYFRELDGHKEEIQTLRKRTRKEHVTLVYAAKDEEHNNAVALREYLQTKA